MRIIGVGDPHLSDVQIRTRLDSTKEVCLEKLVEVGELAKTYKADMVIFTGDFFSVPVRDRGFLCDIVKILNEYPCPRYTIIGNHSGDISYTQFETWQRKDLGILSLTGAIQVLDKCETPEGTIMGLSAYQEKDLTVRPDVFMTVCHMFIGEAFGDDLVVYPDVMKSTYPNLKYVLAGHDHAEYPVQVLVGAKYIRPGSLMRVSSAEQNKRVPKVALIDTVLDTVDYIAISKAKPFDDVFVVKKKQETAKTKSAINKFMHNLKTDSYIDNEIGVSEIMKGQLEKIKAPDEKRIIREDLMNHGFLLEG